MPHLLLFNRAYYPDQSATGQLMTELCEDLVRCHGWEVTVVAGPASAGRQENGSRRGWAPVRRETVRGVTILRAAGTRFPKGRFVGRATNYVSYLVSASVAGVRSKRPDVVMSLTDPPLLGLAALAWARRWRAPFVFQCQDIFPEVARLLEDFRSPALERMLELVNRGLVRRADQIVVIGESMKERLTRLRNADPKKVAIIHNWGDRAASGRENGDHLAARQNMRREFRILHAGNLGLSQGLETVVDAAGLLARDCPGLEVVFIGEGVKKEALEVRARSRGVGNVRFLPARPKDEMTECYRDADVCLVSLKPGLSGFIVPSKFYSILAAGKPYVAAIEEDSEIAAVTREFGAGVLAPPGDPRALADKLRMLYHDRERLDSLARGAENASLLFDRPVAVRAYHDLLSQLVS